MGTLFGNPKIMVSTFVSAFSEMGFGKPEYFSEVKRIKARQKRKRLNKHKKLMKRRSSR